ncbi:bacitracin ABC transporter ATP-binding protein [Anaeromicropila herbilytica]|uniref:Bacitracin ABC transporter ATP-binding protein n=1 Tax=Anaeromicropila herbilytica TaxID=2785025 RepID=A0A7R7IBX5_9FIRM|nr:bacitracin ABC transporter ATP-binding protein [Anaeromicropila herbilytica]
MFGKNIQTQKKHLLPSIGVLLDPPAVYTNLTVEDNLRVLEMIRPKQKRNMADDMMEQLGISRYKSKKANTLDADQKKRLGLAIALLHDPEILILDEPFRGFDFNGMKEVSRLLKNLCDEYGKTILLSSHTLSEVENVADCIGYMEQGNLIEEIFTKDKEEINRQYIYLVVDHVSNIIPIIERDLDIHNFHVVNDNSLKIFDLSKDSGEINTCLNRNGVIVKEIYMHKGSLQEYLNEIGRR